MWVVLVALALLAETTAHHFGLIPASGAEDLEIRFNKPVMRGFACQCDQLLLALGAPRIRPRQVDIVTPIKADSLLTIHSFGNVRADESDALSSVQCAVGFRHMLKCIEADNYRERSISSQIRLGL